MQSPAGATLEAILQLHDYISFFLVIIFTFVTWFFFNILTDFSPTKATQTPPVVSKQEISYKFSSRIVHRGLLEVVWTIIPVLILTAIAVPSFELLYALDTVSKPLISIKCIGNQWFWSYEALSEVKGQKININKNHSGQIHAVVDNETAANFIINRFHAYSAYYMLEKNNFFPVLNWLKRMEYEGKLSSLIYVPNLNSIVEEALIELNLAMALQFDMYGNFLIEAEKKGLFVDYTPEYINQLHWNFSYEKYYIDQLASKSSMELFGVDLTKPATADEVVLPAKFPSAAIKMDSYMIDMDELALGGLRLLETDVFPQLPADCELRFIITSMDVLHSFAVPSLGIKVDAIPGRLNQFGIKVRVPGIYFGQCSELCGVGHGFMPIKLQFVHYKND